MNTQSEKEEKNPFQALMKLKSELESGITNPVDKIDRPSLKLPVEFPDPDEYDSYEPEMNDEEEAQHAEMQEYEEDLEMDLDDGGLSRVNLKKSNRKHSKVRKLRD